MAAAFAATEEVRREVEARPIRITSLTPLRLFKGLGFEREK
jgi:hypothetical protein